MRSGAALLLLAVAAPARAVSVTDEIIVNSTQSSETNPRASVFTDSLNASFDVNDEWTLLAGASLTLLGGTEAATTAGFQQSSSPVTRFNAGAEWALDDQWTLGLTLDLAPSSTQFAVASVPATATTGQVEAEVQSETSELGAAFDLSWDSLGRSDLEWSFSAGLGFSHSAITQSIPLVRSDSGQAVTPAQFTQRYCAAHPRIKNCAQNLADAFSGTQKPVDSERFSAGATATLFLNTDVSLLADVYVYNEYPGVLDTRLAALSGGAGLPIAPLQYLIRPEVLHRFGNLSAKLWIEAGEYVSGTGQDTEGLGIKVQYKFSKEFRAWVTGSGRRDVDDRGIATGSGTIALGAGYRW
jgi:hypothetical protein